MNKRKPAYIAIAAVIILLLVWFAVKYIYEQKNKNDLGQEGFVLDLDAGMIRQITITKNANDSGPNDVSEYRNADSIAAITDILNRLHYTSSYLSEDNGDTDENDPPCWITVFMDDNTRIFIRLYEETVSVDDIVYQVDPELIEQLYGDF